MIYRTVLVSSGGNCCENSPLDTKIQEVLDQYANSGWVLISAHSQKVAACGGPAAGAVLIFGKRAP
jgi:hypothetical protein